MLALAGLGLLVLGWHPTAAPAPGARALATVAVAARPLTAGAVLIPADVALITAPASEALTGLARSVSEVVGRRPRIALPRGQPLSAALLTARAGVAPGHREVSLHLDAGALPEGVGVGDDVDVVAAVAPADGVPGRVVTVVVGAVVAVQPPGAVTLDVEVGAASRLLWAEAFAKELRILAHPAADPRTPPDVDGLGT